MISGWGGDELITFNGRGYLAGLFWGGRWAKLIHALYLGSSIGADRDPFKIAKRLMRNLYNKVFLPSLPDQIFKLVNRQSLTPILADCATLEFMETINQHPRLPQDVLREKVGLHTYQLVLLEYGHLTQRIEAWANNGAGDHLVYVYPLLDKRLIEFSLGIPPDLYVRDGYARYLFRYAMGAEAVRWGNVKGEPVRVAHLLEIGVQAAQIWLSGADLKGEQEHNRYIDPNALRTLSLKGPGDLEKVIHMKTLMNSIQVLVAGKQVEDLKSNRGYNC
jgi:asparagine synthase (glutamine-hydrolysing)